MVGDVTQADRDAAEAYREKVLDAIWAGGPEDQVLLEAFACHRIKTEQKIVEWLRGEVADDSIHSCDQAADAIESGAHLR